MNLEDIIVAESFSRKQLSAFVGEQSDYCALKDFVGWGPKTYLKCKKNLFESEMVSDAEKKEIFRKVCGDENFAGKKN